MYCTEEDILKKISSDELAQLTSATEVIDHEKVIQAIEDADGEIDSYIQRHYAVPVSPVPNVIRKASVTIALYNVWSDRSNKVGLDDTVKDNYEKIVAWLKLAADKKVTLGIDPLPAASNTAVSEPVLIRTNKRNFTQRTMRRF